MPLCALLDSLPARLKSHLNTCNPGRACTEHVAADTSDESIMSTILTSDLFRNFMGGFVIGAVALLALQPRESDAMPQRAAPVAVEAPAHSPA